MEAGKGEPPIDRTGAFGREPSCIGISRRTGDAHNGTMRLFDQGTDLWVRARFDFVRSWIGRGN
jgi:hypothetical protein